MKFTPIFQIMKISIWNSGFDQSSNTDNSEEIWSMFIHQVSQFFKKFPKFRFVQGFLNFLRDAPIVTKFHFIIEWINWILLRRW